MCNNRSIFILLILASLSGQSQDFSKDSLEHVIRTSTNDTLKYLAYDDLATVVYLEDIRYAGRLWMNALKLSDSASGKKELTPFFSKNDPHIMLSVGYYYEQVNNTDSALYFYNQSTDAFVGNRDTHGLCVAYNNLASVYTDLGNIPLALQYYYDALALQELTDEAFGQAITLNNIGYVYNQQGMYAEAIANYKKSLAIKWRIDDVRGIGFSNNNIGRVFANLGETDSAMFYYRNALSAWSEVSYQNGVSNALMNMGDIYLSLDDQDSARYYYNKSLIYADSSDALHIKAMALTGLAKLDFMNSKFTEAAAKGLAAEKIANQIGYPGVIRDVSKLLSDVYEEQGNWSKAFLYLDRYYEMRDSTLNDETQKQAIASQMTYEFEKKELADSLKQAETDRIAEIEHNREVDEQRLYTYLGAAGFLIALIFVLVVYRNYRLKKRDNEIIAQQKEIVEDQHKEILDSITYAKRIQAAILPPKKLLQSYFSDSFILYLPKDVVAGDFYWFEKISGQSASGAGQPVADSILLAAADCTGHGVPGAMVSVVCNNALNRSVREYGLTSPSAILDKTREIVIGEFEKSDDEVKDGMDISLCSVSVSAGILQWAGANNPLWIIRQDEVMPETVAPAVVSYDQARKKSLIEFKADKQPIGKYARQKSFTNHVLKLEKGDTLFIFSDGFQDQFGGEKGKKFKSANLKSKLIEISGHPMEKQSEMLETALKEWRGPIEQVDDVCIIGVRVC